MVTREEIKQKAEEFCDWVQANEDEMCPVTKLGFYVAGADLILPKLEAAEKRISELESKGIHTCHDQCPRLACVQGRRIRELETALHAFGLDAISCSNAEGPTQYIVTEWAMSKARKALKGSGGGE